MRRLQCNSARPHLRLAPPTRTNHPHQFDDLAVGSQPSTYRAGNYGLIGLSGFQVAALPPPAATPPPTFLPHIQPVSPSNYIVAYNGTGSIVALTYADIPNEGSLVEFYFGCASDFIEGYPEPCTLGVVATCANGSTVVSSFVYDPAGGEDMARAELQQVDPGRHCTNYAFAATTKLGSTALYMDNVLVKSYISPDALGTDGPAPVTMVNG